ncbi:MAG: hypothetical protein OSB83_15255 [Planctomycetota bacterium]|nr:hypothetical protein [Planctomycetota bacterium]
MMTENVEMTARLGGGSMVMDLLCLQPGRVSGLLCRFLFSLFRLFLALSEGVGAAPAAWGELDPGFFSKPREGIVGLVGVCRLFMRVEKNGG